MENSKEVLNIYFSITLLFSNTQYYIFFIALFTSVTK